jgi:signal recognition particle GTPase
VSQSAFEGFTWTAAGFWAAAFALLGLIVRQVVPWRQQAIDAEKAFRDGLLARVEKLENTLERKERDAIRQRRLHAAERAVDRHRINNLQQCFDAMLLMIDAAPEKASEIVGKIRKMREVQIQSEATEKAALHAGAIADADDMSAIEDPSEP